MNGRNVAKGQLGRGISELLDVNSLDLKEGHADFLLKEDPWGKWVYSKKKSWRVLMP